ncbi:MAG: ion transporter [Bacteroidales bacterium]|nr:ion transporter [Bacteroidales bacterium]
MKNLRLQIYEVVSPHGDDSSTASRVYDYYQLVAILVSLVPLAFRHYTHFFAIMEYCCVGAFILDYLLRWITADYRLKRGWLSFVYYPFTIMALIDLLSILPTFQVLNEAFHLARITRLFKIVRLLKFGRYSKELAIFISVLKEQKSVLLSVLTLAIFYIIMTALLMFTVDDKFEDFFDALYWVTSALTTVGYGDICPHNDIGRLISMLSSLVGVAIIALPSGVITASYLHTVERLKQRKNISPEEEAQLAAID